MKELDITKIMKANNLYFELCVYFRGNNYTYSSISSLLQFLNTQYHLWESNTLIPNIWDENRSILNSIRNVLSSLISKEESDINIIRSCIDSIKQITNRTPYFQYNQRAITYISQVDKNNTSYSKLIIQQFLQPDGINIYGNGFQVSNMFNYVIGLISCENNIIEESAELNQKTIDFINLSETKLKAIINEKNEQIENNNSVFKQLIEEKNKITDETIKTHKELFESIEKTYEEKVRIAKPSELWETKKSQYSRRGGWWTCASILCSLIICGIGLIFFIFFPDIFSNTIDEGINITGSVKWLILTSVGIGSLIYMLRLSVKLALSSFHMSRDAEEKCALTSFYLSLINDKKLDPDNEKELKNIVMNALFARVETGLLKGDNSPTIPTAGFSEAVRLVSGKQT